MNLRNLSRRMAAAPNLIRDGVNAKVKALAKDIVVDLIHITPVDTSKALSNWQLALSAPLLTELQPYAPGAFGSTAAQSRDAAKQSALASLSRRQPGVPIYISNNTEYIMALNLGSSRQAPAGFVDSVMLRSIRNNANVRILP